ncbi:hypothetical protein, partial [Facilibium subflavum]|uniref:hypothetical protein n=1 Tax=Facilibium subflavum TaxID=2219058 RepID=UPI0013C2DDEF
LWSGYVKAIINNLDTYKGQDSLPITPAILNAYQISVKTETMESLQDALKYMDIDCLQQLINDPSKSNDLLAGLKTLDDAVLLCVQTPSDKLEPIFSAVFDKFLAQKNVESWLIPIIENDKIAMMFRVMASKMTKFGDVLRICDELTPQQLEAIKADTNAQALFRDLLKNPLVHKKADDYVNFSLQFTTLFKQCIESDETLQAQFLQAFNEFRVGNSNILQRYVATPEYFNMIVAFYGTYGHKEALLKLVTHQNSNGKTILHQLINQPERLSALLDQLPEELRLRAITKESTRIFVGNVLHTVASNSITMLVDILAKLPKTDRLSALLCVNSDDESLLETLDNSQGLPFIKNILLMLPEQDRFKALTHKNKRGVNCLHQLAEYKAGQVVLSELLSTLSIEDRLNAVRQKNNYGESLIYRIVSNPDCLSNVLAQLPEDKRLAVLYEGNKVNNQTVLEKCAEYYPEGLQVILQQLPEADRLQALLHKDQSGMNMLELFIDSQQNLPNSLSGILETLSASSCLHLIQAKNDEGNNILLCTR